MHSFTFKPDDHAFLFAWLARVIIDDQPKGGALVEDWVATYGRERGARNARRCMDAGASLTVQNYFLYSAWNDERVWLRSQASSFAPYHFKGGDCAWAKIWREHGLEKYGEYYCRGIVVAQVHGFNPALAVEVTATRTAGDGVCSFLWPEQALLEEDLAMMNQRYLELRSEASNDFLYSSAHLYDALRRVLTLHLGLKDAESILAKGFAEYAKCFGEKKAKALQKASRKNVFIL